MAASRGAATELASMSRNSRRQQRLHPTPPDGPPATTRAAPPPPPGRDRPPSTTSLVDSAAGEEDPGASIDAVRALTGGSTLGGDPARRDDADDLPCSPP